MPKISVLTENPRLWELFLARFYLWMFLLGSSALVLFSCGADDRSQSRTVSVADESIEHTAGEPEYGDWLVMRVQAEPGTLNPITATDAYERIVNSLVYESLTERDFRTLEWKPVLAESWETSPDHLVHTFYLRRDVRWHNGEPFTAKDILYSFERMRDPSVMAAHLRGYYQDVEKLEALDDYTVRFTFSTEYYLSFESAAGLPIVPQSVFDDGQDFNTHPASRSPVGTGPYRFREWRTGQEIVVERNPDYWRKEAGKQGYVDRVVYRIATDPTTALQMLRAGQLDMMTRFQQVQWARQTSSPQFTEKFHKFEFYVPEYSYVGWNSLRPFFADKRCRRAMTHLFDREAFVEKVLYGLGHVVSGNLFFKSPYYDSSIEPWPYDPAEARRLLDEAGWVDSDGDGIRDKDGVRFAFTFTIPAASKNAERIATLLKEELDQVGILMDIERLEWALFIEKIQQKRYDASTMAWSLPWSVDLYQVWHSTSAGPNGSNYVSFIHEEADQIIEELRNTFDEDKRIELCHRFHRIVHEEQPYTFLWCSAELMAVDKRFQDVETFRTRPGYDIREWWVPSTMRKFR